LAGGECRAELKITVGSYDFTDSGGFTAAQQTLAKNLFQSAINTWVGTIDAPFGKNVAVHITTVKFSNALSGNGATQGATADADGLPKTVDAVSISTTADMFYSATITGIGAKQRDAYSTMLHELGHVVGFNYRDDKGDGYQKWNDRVDADKATFQLAAAFGGGKVTLAGKTPNGLSHVKDA